MTRLCAGTYCEPTGDGRCPVCRTAVRLLLSGVVRRHSAEKLRYANSDSGPNVNELYRQISGGLVRR